MPAEWRCHLCRRTRLHLLVFGAFHRGVHGSLVRSLHPRCYGARVASQHHAVLTCLTVDCLRCAPHCFPSPPFAVGRWQRQRCSAHAGVRQATQALGAAAGFLRGFLAGFLTGFFLTFCTGFACGAAPAHSPAVLSALAASRRSQAPAGLQATLKPGPIQLLSSYNWL